MPYKIFQEDDEWCVYRVDDAGKPIGETLGCHDSEDEAENQVKALYANEPEARSAIGVHHTATDSGVWDGPANEARVRSGESENYYRRIYAWLDPDGDPKTKSAWRFIHHLVDGDGNPGPANLRACSTGIGVLNGARGGTTIPDADRRGVYNHLAAHLRDGDMEPPDLRESGVEIERRSFPGQVRVIELNGKRSISGYAAMFGHESEDLGGFREVIEPGAFAESIQHDDVRALFNHDPCVVLGRTPKTLQLREDETGLFYEIDPPDTQAARDLLVSLQRGDISQSSFGFTVISQQVENPNEQRNYILRRVKKVRLFDVSPVTFPAYPTTSAEVRALVSQLSRRATVQNQGEPAGRLDVLKRKLRLIE